MKIRALTYFYDPNQMDHGLAMDQCASHAFRLKRSLRSIGIDVETTRLATSPFPTWLDCDEPYGLVEKAVILQNQAKSLGFAYISFGPALPEQPRSYRRVPAILKETDSLFVTGFMTRENSVVDLNAVRACAWIIHQTAPQHKDGFNNLRFSALGNVPPNCPYFPSAYAEAGNGLGFALAIESADAAYTVFSKAASFESARTELLEQLHSFTREIELEIAQVTESSDFTFHGFDISLAPYPAPGCSLGEAIETLGLPGYGLAGSLAASAFVTSTLDMGKWRKAGFNGLMAPVLEDAMLAQRAADGTLTVKDLVMFSAVCGTGLDTLPLPGDVSEDQLYAILLDIAALSQRLSKPLTARLMPIPGKQPGDETSFDFEYFANSRVMGLAAEQLTNLFASETELRVPPRILKAG